MEIIFENPELKIKISKCQVLSVFITAKLESKCFIQNFRLYQVWYAMIWERSYHHRFVNLKLYYAYGAEYF